MSIKVRMLEPGFIEGKRRRVGEVFSVMNPHFVSFKAMELFSENDIEVVKKAKTEFLKSLKTKSEEQKKLEPKIVNPEKDDPKPIKVDPNSGKVIEEVDADGDSDDFTKSVI